MLKNGNNGPARTSFDKYYMPLVKKTLLDQPVRNKHKAYENVLKMSGNDDHTTGNILDHLHYPKYYKPIGRDLSRQKNRSIPQQIDFVGKLEEDDGATMFFIAEKQQKTILNLYLDSLIVKK